MEKVAIIMAGGAGIRLWPRSTEKKPKQFTHLIGDGTMIQNTVMRLLPMFQPEEIFIVAGEVSMETLYDQLPVIPKENIIPEPFSKHTTTCLALVATHLKDRLKPDTIMLAFPSDHIVSNVREFHNSLEVACQVALEKKSIVTIGITPTRPEPDFGYIQIKDDRADLNDYYDKGVRYSTAFAEKPDQQTAKRFLESGDFLWNSGIFIWRTDVFWEAFEKYLPENYKLFERLLNIPDLWLNKEEIELVYRQIQAVSVDYAILEKDKNIYVVQASFKWSDVGTWDELYRLSLKDGRNNYIEGEVVAINTSNCYVSSSNKLIGMVDVDNLIVVDGEDAILICKRGKTENVKDVIDYLKRKQINKYL